jgi:hypothetical protein
MKNQSLAAKDAKKTKNSYRMKKRHIENFPRKSCVEARGEIP